MARGTNSRYITAIKENDDLKEFESELLRFGFVVFFNDSYHHSFQNSCTKSRRHPKEYRTQYDESVQ